MTQIATKKSWEKFLNENCPDLFIDFGFPLCPKKANSTCFLGYKEPQKNEHECPNGLKLKDKKLKIWE